MAHLALAGDPWDWGIDDVVHAVCEEGGWLRATLNLLKFDFTAVSQAIRTHQLVGRFLLVDIDRRTLQDVFAIKQFGVQMAIMQMVQHLRSLSPGFQEWKASVAERGTLPAVTTPLSGEASRNSGSASTALRGLLSDANPCAETSHAHPCPLSITQNRSSSSHSAALPAHSAAADLSSDPSAPFGVPVLQLPAIEALKNKDQKRATFIAEAYLYLGPHALSREELLFGEGAIGAQIHLEVGVATELQARAAFQSGSPFRVEVAYELGSRTRAGAGRQLLANRSMKAFLMRSDSKNPVYYQDSQNLATVGIKPFATRIILKRKSTRPNKRLLQQTPPRTLMIIHPGPMKHATRELLSSWQPLMRGSIDIEPPGPFVGLDLQSAQVNFWDRLFDKYTNLEHTAHDLALPLYGDSDSDNGYDSETWEEMVAEKEEMALDPQPAHLSPTEALETIKTAKQTFIDDWAVKKRPKLQARAYNIWYKSHKDNVVEYHVEGLELEAKSLEQRLRRYENQIEGERWLHKSELQKQCEVLYQTIQLLCEVKYKLELLNQAIPPEKPCIENKPPAPQKTRPVRQQPMDEEDLTDDDIDDFIVDDTPALAPQQNLKKTPPAPDFIDLTLDDASPGKPSAQNSGDSVSKQEDVAVLGERELNKLAAHPKLLREDYLNMPVHMLRRIPKFQIKDLGAEVRVAWILANQRKREQKLLKHILNDSNLNLLGFSKLLLNALKGLKGRQYSKIRALGDIDASSALRLAQCYFAWRFDFWRLEADAGADETEAGDADFLEQNAQSQHMDHILKSWPQDDINDFYEFILDRMMPMANSYEVVATDRRSNGEPQTGSNVSATANGSVRKKSKASSRDLVQNADVRQKALHMQLFNHAKASGSQPSREICYINHSDGHSQQIALNTHISHFIKEYQIDGVGFLWTQLIRKQEGCLLAHSMGTGKTLQVVAFLDTLAETALNQTNAISKQLPVGLRVAQYLVIVPPSLVGNWHDEFLKWLPIKKGGIGSVLVIWPGFTPSERLQVMEKWRAQRGVLLISTNLFRDTVITNLPASEDARVLREVGQLLLRLPSVVVIDEAQEIRNQGSKLHQAVAKIHSRYRIALTGSPLANHLVEYFNLIDWASPGYLSDTFKDKFVSKISEGLYVDASPESKRQSLMHLEVLKRHLEPKVHRIDASVLNDQLYGKTEFLVRVPLTELQVECYQTLLDSIPQASKGGEIEQTQLWAYLHLLRMLCNHPGCLHDYFTMKQATTKKTKSRPGVTKKPANKDALTPITDLVGPRPAGDYPGDIEEGDEKAMELSSNILSPEKTQQVLDIFSRSGSWKDVTLSGKTYMLAHILTLCSRVGEKALIFSHSLRTLDLVQRLLDELKLSFVRIDGSTKTSTRHEDARIFNEDQGTHVCLVSTRAGGTGLNLFGASRVVIMDEWFNPMHEQQAIGRAYRIGQMKHVYVYRLLTADTFEETMQNLGSFKSTLASRVLDSKQSIRRALRDAGSWLRRPGTPAFQDLASIKGHDLAVLGELLESGAMEGRVCSIQTGDSISAEQEELTQEEREQAKQLLDQERAPVAAVDARANPVCLDGAGSEAESDASKASCTGRAYRQQDGSFDHGACNQQ